MSAADFAERYGPWAILAGGSEGLGVAFAHRLAKHGLKLLVIARKSEPLEALAKDIRAQYGTEVRTLAQDLTAPDAVANIIAATQGCDVGMLVYNAGADTRVLDFLERPLDESMRLAALNVTTPMSLVHHLAPAMAKRRKGGIILLSSFASAVGTPGNAVYASTKAFSNIFAEGMWYELGKHGIHVLGTIIGIVRTPAMERMGLSFEGLSGVADPYDLADEALANIDKGPTLHAGGVYDNVYRYRTMPRGEAVETIVRFSNSVVANEQS